MCDQQKRFDSFNDHQKDVRGRATQLANYAFLIAGGAFTASVSVFSSNQGKGLKPEIVQPLHEAWAGLSYSMIAFFSLVMVMIIRDYLHAELSWRRRLHGKEPLIGDRWMTGIFVLSDTTLFALAMLGFFWLCTALGLITKAATIFVQ